MTRLQPDFGRFLKVLRRTGRPDRLPFYEHNAQPEFVARATGEPVDRLGRGDRRFWEIYARFWADLGFDCLPMEVHLDCPFPKSSGKASVSSEAAAMIRSHEDFERFPWPSESEPIDFSQFELAAGCLPEGMKIVGGVGRGPFEWASTLMGIEGLSLAVYQQPDLVERMFEMLGRLIVSANRQLAQMDAIGALRQGDDLGFRTATFLPPEHLRRYVFPVYRELVRAAHDRGKPYILHCCGNLDAIYGELIDCGFDAKHSFEDAILPVARFKQRYGDRITPLGGLDVDRICRAAEDDLRSYARRAIEDCYAADGYWALGTGNQLTAYMPVQNYLWVLDEARQVAG